MNTPQEKPNPPATGGPRHPLRGWGKFLARTVLWILLIVYWAWAIGAAWHFNVAPKFLRIVLAVLIIVVPLIVSIRTRSSKFVSLAILGAIAVMALCWQLLVPSNERAWKPELAKTPISTVADHRVEITNYLAYEGPTTQSFDLREMKQVWFGVEKFADFGGGAHNFLSFEFNDGKFVSVSVEARKEVGEEFALLPALFRQFELIYLIGDEAQIFGARSDFSAPMYLYPLKSSHEERVALFLDMCNRSNELAGQPEWYNILTNNCTNNLSWHASRIAPRPISSYDMRVVISGHTDRLLYEMGLLDVEGELTEIEERCRVDEIGKQIEIDSQFPLRIRERL